MGEIHRAGIVAVVALLAMPPAACGQRSAPTGVVARSTIVAPVDAAARKVGAERVLIGAAIGGGVGVAAGLMGAYVMTTSGTYPDHSEDSMSYILLGILGGLVGAIVGALVGLGTS